MCSDKRMRISHLLRLSKMVQTRWLHFVTRLLMLWQLVRKSVVILHRFVYLIPAVIEFFLRQF